MALQAVAGGLVMIPVEANVIWGLNFSQQNLDAAGESVAFIGHARLSTGPGTSTTIDAGAKIYFISNATTTFAAAAGGTVVRVGIQGVNAANGLENGSWDVYDDLVSGTDTITENVTTAVTMSTGTKTITHGDIIAVVIEMTARTAPDQLRVRIGQSSTAGYPYITVDSGGGPGVLPNFPIISIESDNDGGCLIELDGGSIPSVQTQQSFNSGSTPNEYALVFQVPFKCKVDGLAGVISEIDTTETGELILYRTPLGTPDPMASIAPDPDIWSLPSAASAIPTVYPITEQTLEPNTDYAVAYRPTSTGNRVLVMTTVPTATHRKFLNFGENASRYQRVSGAFNTQSTTVLPVLGIRISALDDGVSGGGGLASNPVRGYIG